MVDGKLFAKSPKKNKMPDSGKESKIGRGKKLKFKKNRSKNQLKKIEDQMETVMELSLGVMGDSEARIVNVIEGKHSNQANETSDVPISNQNTELMTLLSSRPRNFKRFRNSKLALEKDLGGELLAVTDLIDTEKKAAMISTENG